MNKRLLHIFLTVTLIVSQSSAQFQDPKDVRCYQFGDYIKQSCISIYPHSNAENVDFIVQASNGISGMRSASYRALGTVGENVPLRFLDQSLLRNIYQSSPFEYAFPVQKIAEQEYLQLSLKAGPNLIRHYNTKTGEINDYYMPDSLCIVSTNVLVHEGSWQFMAMSARNSFPNSYRLLNDSLYHLTYNPSLRKLDTLDVFVKPIPKANYADYGVGMFWEEDSSNIVFARFDTLAIYSKNMPAVQKYVVRNNEFIFPEWETLAKSKIVAYRFFINADSTFQRVIIERFINQELFLDTLNFKIPEVLTSAAEKVNLFRPYFPQPSGNHYFVFSQYDPEQGYDRNTLVKYNERLDIEWTRKLYDEEAEIRTVIESPDGAVFIGGFFRRAYYQPFILPTGYKPIEDPFIHRIEADGTSASPYDDKIDVFPNPASYAFQVYGEQMQNYQLLNASGLLLEFGVLNPKENSFELEVYNRPAGLYFLRVKTTKGETLIRKLVVRRF